MTRFHWAINVPSYLVPTAVASIMVFGYQYLQENEGKEVSRLPFPEPVRWGAYGFMLICIYVLGARPVPFIYFQF